MFAQNARCCIEITSSHLQDDLVDPGAGRERFGAVYLDAILVEDFLQDRRLVRLDRREDNKLFRIGLACGVAPSNESQDPLM